MKKALMMLFIPLLFLNQNEIEINEENETSFYILSFPNYNISTNNISTYFNDVDIIWIHPYDKYNIIDNYYFNNFKLETNMNNFLNFYKNRMNKFGYKEESINASINGVKIEKLKVYIDNKKLKQIKIENMKIKKM